MSGKPDNNTEIKYIFTLVLSSVLLVLIFGAVWVIKKFKEGSV
jgi:hypothetical protein